MELNRSLHSLYYNMLLQKSVNDAEEFSFASGEKEAIIVELKEEARILRARMENNPEVKRHAGAFSCSTSCHFCPALVRWLVPLLPWFPFAAKLVVTRQLSRVAAVEIAAAAHDDATPLCRSGDGGAGVLPAGRGPAGAGSLTFKVVYHADPATLCCFTHFMQRRTWR